MAKKEEEYLSKNAYASYLGINEKAIRNAIAIGKIKKGWDAERQKVIKRIADREFGHLHKVSKPRPGVSSAKLADKIKSEKSPNKTGTNSDKSEVKTVVIAEKSATKKKSEQKAKKSEQIDEDDDDFEYVLEEGFSLGDLISSIKITPTLEYGEAMRRREILQLAADKIKIEEQHGALLKKVDVDKTLYVAADQIKKALMAIPQRCADEILHAENKVDVINIMMKEITEALGQLADLENIKLNK